MAEDPDGIVQALLAEDPFLLQDPQLGGYGDPNPKDHTAVLFGAEVWWIRPMKSSPHAPFAKDGFSARRTQDPFGARWSSKGPGPRMVSELPTQRMMQLL